MTARAATMPARFAGDSSHAALRVAVIAALSATAMLFASLSSAYLVRRSLADWAAPRGLAWPWFLLALAIAVSFFLEAGLRAASSPLRRKLLLISGFLCALYLVGAGGVVAALVSNDQGLRAPHSAFVALLLSLHILHSLAGGAFTVRLLRSRDTPSMDGSTVFLARSVTHFLATLLLLIVILLFVIR